MKLDILVITAHPDDAELGAGGTIINEVNRGKKVGILDLTRGEMGTRGTAETRAEEAEAARNILGVSTRDNVGLPDGFLENIRDYQMRIIPFIRRYKPEIVLANAMHDRHPDHGKGGKLIADSCFLSGLRALETKYENNEIQAAWRPKSVYHLIQDRYIEPNFVVDVSEVWDRKMEAIKAYKTQFDSPVDSAEPQTPISTPDFIYFLEARAREYGRTIGVRFGEGFTSESGVGVKSLFDLF